MTCQQALSSPVKARLKGLKVNLLGKDSGKPYLLVDCLEKMGHRTPHLSRDKPAGHQFKREIR